MSAQLRKIKFDRKEKHILGAKLGEGAQGTIYALQKKDGSDSNWCAKITVIAKKTKSGRSVDELNENALNYERLMYQSTFTRLRGHMIPSLPKESGETKYLNQYKKDLDAGYVFLVMERMEMPLIDAVKLIPVKDNAVSLAELAQRLLNIVKEFHTSNKLITDVKSDNFMIARGTGTVAERLRMVDLALLRDMTNEYGKLVPNEGVSSLRGTPLYASFNAHDLQSPSRRDDVESLVYVLAELVIAVHAEHAEPKPQWYKKGEFLPWCNGTSDDDIYKLKKQYLEDQSSEFYGRMPTNLASLFQNLLKECRRCKYKEAPNYDLFSTLFSQLIVSVRLPDQKRKAAPLKSGRNSPRRKTGRRAQQSAPSDESAGDPMDIDEEGTTPENIDPRESRLSEGFKQDRKFEAATITVIKGPHKGEHWILQENGQEKYCIGSNPSKKKDHLSITLSKDKSILCDHARIKLALHKKRLLIQIWDMSKGNTKINGSVKQCAEFALFDNDTFEMGVSTLQVSRATRPSHK